MDSVDKWLLCAPHYFDVRYEINAWMNRDHVPDQQRAWQQWEQLVKALSRLPVSLCYVVQGAEWPDMVFTANAGLVYQGKVILSKFRHCERSGEEPLFEKWFNENGYHVLHLKDCNFEGEGDALFAGEKLFCAYGFRSDREAYGQIATLLNLSKLVFCHLVNPSFYHLDTCFCPISPAEALCVIEAFDSESIRVMEREISLIPVVKQDAALFACNALVIGKDIVLPFGCSTTCKVLEGKGFQTHQVEMSEFMKAGGASKCLALRLSNSGS